MTLQCQHTVWRNGLERVLGRRATPNYARRGRLPTPRRGATPSGPARRPGLILGPPPSRTKWTRGVPHPVLIGHDAPGLILLCGRGYRTGSNARSRSCGGAQKRAWSSNGRLGSITRTYLIRVECEGVSSPSGVRSRQLPHQLPRAARLAHGGGGLTTVRDGSRGARRTRGRLQSTFPPALRASRAPALPPRPACSRLGLSMAMGTRCRCRLPEGSGKQVGGSPHTHSLPFILPFSLLWEELTSGC